MSSVFLALFLLPWLQPTTSPSEEATPGRRAGDPELIAAPGARIVRQLENPGTVFEAVLDGGLLRAVQTSFVAPDSGDHWIAVASRDGAGNLSPVRWLRLRVDGVSPTVEIRFEPVPVEGQDRRSWLPAGSRVLVLAEDAVAGVETSHLALGDGVAKALGGTASRDLPLEKDVEIRGWAVDLVGNRSEDSRATVSLDGRPPRVGVALQGPHVEVEGRWVVGPTTRAEAELADEESGLERWVPALGGVPVAESEWAGPWGAGDHELGGHALDRVGNRRELEPFPVRVDVTPPQIHWDVRSEAMVEVDGRRVFGPQVEVQARGEDGEAGVASLEWSLTGQEWRSMTGPVETTASSLVLRGVDRVGNTAELPVQWVLDETAPVVEVRLASGEPVPPGGRILVRDGGFITLGARDDEAGVDTLGYSLDAAAWKTGTERLRFVGSRRSELRVRAEDRLGNVALATFRVEVSRDGEGER